MIVPPRFAFQFPFHRDGPCDPHVEKEAGPKGHFQFPFHRDGPCDLILCQKPMSEEELSVPFSSGWALRCLELKINGRCLTPFSSLFIGMGLAIHRATRERGPDISFQFPFHRDGPCDRHSSWNNKNILKNLSVPFSSGWALRSGIIY